MIPLTEENAVGMRVIGEFIRILDDDNIKPVSNSL
jgi:hypothetical protein